jgi:hypothetical protein
MLSEVYDPAAGMFSVTGQMNAPRRVTTATLLNNGMVLVAGGYNDSGTVASAELYDPTTGAFTLTGSMNQPRSYHTSTLLPNGMVLIAGGHNPANGLVVPLAGAELYDPTTGTFTQTQSMNFARYDYTAALLSNGNVLMAGGFGTTGVLSSAELFQPSTGTFTLTGSLNAPRSNQHTAILKNGMVLVVGGGDQNEKPLATAELYEPAQ